MYQPDSDLWPRRAVSLLHPRVKIDSGPLLRNSPLRSFIMGFENNSLVHLK